MRAGVEHLVGTWVISGEVGVGDPALFRRACSDLGVDPRRTPMMGDDPVRDGERGLADVLALSGLPRVS